MAQDATELCWCVAVSPPAAQPLLHSSCALQGLPLCSTEAVPVTCMFLRCVGLCALGYFLSLNTAILIYFFSHALFPSHLVQHKKRRLHYLLLPCITQIIPGLLFVVSSRSDRTCFTLWYLNYSRNVDIEILKILSVLRSCTVLALLL